MLERSASLTKFELQLQLVHRDYSWFGRLSDKTNSFFRKIAIGNRVAVETFSSSASPAPENQTSNLTTERIRSVDLGF
jgi:hypothetical protein